MKGVLAEMAEIICWAQLIDLLSPWIPAERLWDFLRAQGARPSWVLKHAEEIISMFRQMEEGFKLPHVRCKASRLARYHRLLGRAA